uniref:Uncharacterized protein n=1 Tax=Anopheles epiroticus TaxID=199890 RepID=A0A182PPY3_9DIPT
MENFAEIFTTIKPLFDAVIRKPTQEGIVQLNEQLKKVDNSSVQILQNIFLQQLIILVDAVQGQNKNELKTHLLECIITILQKGRLSKAVAMRTTLLATTKLVYDRDTGKLHPNLSEEYKLAVLKVLSLASRRIHSELVEEVYVKENLTLLSQTIFVCVRIVETERARKLRFQAVDSILSLLQVHDEFDVNDVVLRCQVAELLFITLPKLLATFVSIINGDEKQGTAVYRIAIKALGRTLSLIFEDYAKETTIEEYSIERFQQLSASLAVKDRNPNVLGLGLREDDKIKYFNETLRTREWLLEAEQKVEKVLQHILHLRGHEEELIRLEFAKMSCELNMPSCTVHYLQTVIAMCHDESARVREVCERCQNSVPYFTISFAGNRIDELFFDALKQLPRTIYRGEEREQIASFRLITGFLGFFTKPQLASVLSSQPILEQFIAVLLAAAELESVPELLRREYVSYRFEYEEGFHLLKEKNESRWIVLKNLSSPRSKQSFLDLIHKLRQHDQAIQTVFMYVLENFYSSRINSNGYLLILSELIPEDANDDHQNRSLMEPFKALLSEVLQTHHWFLELDENDSIADQKYNALHICLVVRTIARLARFMKEQFRWYLYDALRILLQCCGSTLNCINESTELALDIVASSQGMMTIERLIHHNLDYISLQITRCLRRKEHFRDGMNILEAVLRFVPYETSNVLETTVTPIVMNILDSYSQYGTRNSIVCLRVLQIFIHSIRLRYQHESEHPADATNEKALTNLSEQIKRLQTLLRLEISNGSDDLEFKTDYLEEQVDPNEPSEQAEVENKDETETEQKEENLPSHIKIVLRILTVNFKHLASSEDAERIVALSTLNEGIHVLQRYENQLLPLVHNIWFNFTERFSDRNPAVVSNAFELLLTMAQLSKDFIRKRSLDDVLPKLYKFMQDHWNADASAHQVYKLQCKFLTSIDGLVQNLNFSEKQLDQTLEIVRLYWKKCERRELRKQAAECLQRMRSLNSLADQIIRHNTLLDASEKFPKSPSIENLVKQCMKGTNALTNLKERVTCYKLAKQQKRSSTRKSLPNASLLHEMPNIIQNTLNCAKELYQLSEDLIQLSSSFDQSLMNRSSTASQSIKDTTERLLEIEQMWKNMPSPDAEEGSSLGLLHESDMHDTGDFLNDDTSQSLNGIFEQLNHSLEEVLKTPNTHSLTHLKSHLKECQKLLSNITLNHSQLNDESMPSLADSREVPEVPLLNVVADELSKSWKSEIEAFLEIWKSPEKERFLQMSQQTIEDLSFLSQETNHMLDTMKMSAYVKQVEPSRKKHLIDRLNMLRSSEATVQRPNYTSIIMKDYIDEDDLCAEQECCSKVESSKRTVQFTSNIDGVTALPVQSSTSIPKQGERMELVETRLQTLLTEMNKFKQNYLNPENSQEERHQDTKIEHKIDELMAMITEIVHALKAN